MKNKHTKPKAILITGGAGFIGSNLVESLMHDDRVRLIRVLDNFSTGFRKNLEPFMKSNKFQLIEGDIRNYRTCKEACEEIDIISHQAALGSVPRSIADPISTNEVNISGTLNIFYAAVESNIKRVVFAASSSTYGDSLDLPKLESKIGKPLSPYAVTKYVNEVYAEVFSKTYDFEYIGLRYFNVFGKRQDAHGAYAAVIPLFFKAAMEHNPPIINGDGSYSRDFTYIDNAIEANLLSLFTESKDALNQIYNVACGQQTNLNQLWKAICEITKNDLEAKHGPQRNGDIPHSLADINKAKTLLGYNGNISVKEGLEKAYQFYKEQKDK